MATSLGSLGVLLARMGELEEAREHMGRSAAIHVKVFGPEHPSTKIAWGNLERFAAM